MKYSKSTDFKSEIQSISNLLELINYRPRTIESYLQAIFDCCEWLRENYNIPISEADVDQLRAFLVHLKREKERGGLGYAPRSVNLYNCALKKYFRYILKTPLTNDDLPLCRVDHPLPKVPSKKEVFTIILGEQNLKHRAELAVAYGAGLRLNEVATLRFCDISFSKDMVTITAGNSKSRYAGNVELSHRLKAILYEYWKTCCKDAAPEDWLFPGTKKGTHISKTSLANVLKKRLKALGWEDRGYSYHSLRHAQALHYYQAGADLFQVQQRLRHRSLASTLIYVQLDAKLKERNYIENPFDDKSF